MSTATILPEETVPTLVTPAAPAPPAGGWRDVRIDFLRGLAMLFMFVEHVPGSVLRYLTPAATCIASCTDAFILISGYVCGTAFSRSMERKGLATCWRGVLKRCGVLYLSHVATLLVTFAFLSSFAATALMDPPNADLLANAVTMRWMPEHFGILTVYIVLLSFAPGIIWLIHRHPSMAFGLTAVAYLLMQVKPEVADVLMQHGPAAWINPFAWHTLYAIGAWLGVRKYQGKPSVPEVRWVLSVALAIVVAGAAWKVIRFAVVNDIAGAGTALGMPGVLLPIPEKINLSPLRLLSALACGYVGLAVVRRAWKYAPARLVSAVGACGMNSLPVFCVHLVLVYLAQVFLRERAPLGREFLVVGTGLLTLLAVGQLLARHSQCRKARRLGKPEGELTLALRTLPTNS